MFTLNLYSIYGGISPTARVHRSQNRGVETGKVALVIIPTDPLANFLPPVPITLGTSAAKLEVLAPKRGTFPPGDTTMISLNCKFSTLGPHASQSTSKEGSSDHQGETGLLHHKEVVVRKCVSRTQDMHQGISQYYHNLAPLMIF